MSTHPGTRGHLPDLSNRCLALTHSIPSGRQVNQRCLCLATSRSFPCWNPCLLISGFQERRRWVRGSLLGIAEAAAFPSLPCYLLCDHTKYLFKYVFTCGVLSTTFYTYTTQMYFLGPLCYLLLIVKMSSLMLVHGWMSTSLKGEINEQKRQH